MKIIVLEHPRLSSENRFNDIANTPLWSCLMGGYAASSLEKAGFDTLFMDDAVPNADFDRTKEKILAHNPDLLCVNTVYFWEHTPRLFDFFSDLKKIGFTGHLNLFGFFPSLVYKKMLKASLYVDSIAVGEFEKTLPELAACLESNENIESANIKSTALEAIEGLATKSSLDKNDNIMRSPEKDLDQFSFPKRAGLDGSVTVLASRGCYNHCSFCPIPSFYNQGSLWRGRSCENIMLEMEELVEKGVKDFYFVDPNFVGPGRAGKKRTMEFLDRLIPLEITFGMETRPNDLDDELMEKFARAGLQTLLLGIESGSGNALTAINKSSDASVGIKAIQLCRKYGIEPEVGFLMFIPDNTLSDLKENMVFLQENDLLDRLERTANLLCHCQIVLAGTTGYKSFESCNRLKKSGIFGFEAEVLFTDPGVEWMSKLVVFACHTILRSMSDSASPIFWENNVTPLFQDANNYLVNLFFSLLSEAEQNGVQNNIQEKKNKIANEIHLILYGSTGNFLCKDC